MTIYDLARVLSEEFERDAWGDIDPYLFQHVADSEEDPSMMDPNEYDHATDADGLAQTLQRIVERLAELPPG